MLNKKTDTNSTSNIPGLTISQQKKVLKKAQNKQRKEDKKIQEVKDLKEKLKTPRNKFEFLRNLTSSIL